MPTIDSPIIESLPARERERLLNRSIARTLHAGQRLYMAGDRARRAHFVVRGVIKLTARDADGNETILGLAVPGELIGEVAAVDHLPQPMDAVAATHTELIGIDADLLLEVLQSNARAALEIARLLAQRNRWMSETALERTSSEVPARLAGRLLDLADLLGRVERGAIEMDLPLGQGDLGRLAGMCRESACKTLVRFRKAGLLEYRGRKLRILRPDALERIRCAGKSTALG